MHLRDLEEKSSPAPKEAKTLPKKSSKKKSQGDSKSSRTMKGSTGKDPEEANGITTKSRTAATASKVCI